MKVQTSWWGVESKLDNALGKMLCATNLIECLELLLRHQGLPEKMDDSRWMTRITANRSEFVRRFIHPEIQRDSHDFQRQYSRCTGRRLGLSCTHRVTVNQLHRLFDNSSPSKTDSLPKKKILLNECASRLGQGRQGGQTACNMRVRNT